MELNQYRKELDEINLDLLHALEKRMDVVEKVSKYKQQHNMPILQQNREDEILQNMCAQAKKENIPAVREFFSMLMRISREYQYDSCYQNSKLFNVIQTAKQKISSLPCSPQIMCQGVPGSYSHQCAQEMFSDGTIQFCKNFADVFDAISGGGVDVGVLPIENSSSGSILPVFDLMRKNHFYIYQSHKIKINHCLLGLPGARLSDITQVFSHEQGIWQCSDFLEKHASIHSASYSNTAAAAKFVKEKNDPSCGAIASKLCSNLYGLEVLEEGIQNISENYTRFIAITREFYVPEKANKISLFLTLPNRQGSLSEVLSRFAMNGLNLTKLESRPLGDGDFSFLFFLEFEGKVSNPSVEKLLCRLSEELDLFTFLGNYTEVH